MTKMKKFLDEDFLLESAPASALYHDYAASMPIIDYHCHLPAEQIASDAPFASITELWLQGDHYKWRAMRTNGIPERLCSGNASDWEKFAAWAQTVPFTAMNPLYHWTHLELQRVFGISELLTPNSARSIYEQCNARLQSPELRPRGLLRRFRVVALCTMDDPVEALMPHQRIKEDEFEVAVLPGFRADRALAIDRPDWPQYLERLGSAAGEAIQSPRSLLRALNQRHEHFVACGCVTSDHGEAQIFVEPYTAPDIVRIVRSARSGRVLSSLEVRQFKSWGLYELACMDHSRGLVQQFHLGALRDINSRGYRRLGADAGYDAMGEFPVARPLASFLNRLDEEGRLASTIVYSINPAHNEVLASLIGCFGTDAIPGKIQAGTAWWFMDTRDGMERQMTALASIGLLSRFVGMLTDSRSFLSYTRHEYFRRLLCNLIGGQVARGELPNDMPWLGQLVQAICYGNARDYFGLTFLPPAP